MLPDGCGTRARILFDSEPGCATLCARRIFPGTGPTQIQEIHRAKRIHTICTQIWHSLHNAHTCSARALCRSAHTHTGGEERCGHPAPDARSQHVSGRARSAAHRERDREQRDADVGPQPRASRCQSANWVSDLLIRMGANGGVAAAAAATGAVRAHVRNAQCDAAR